MGGQHACVPGPEPRAYQGTGQAKEQCGEKPLGTRGRAACCGFSRLARLLLGIRQCRHRVLLHSRHPPCRFLLTDACLSSYQGGEAVAFLVGQAAIDYPTPGQRRYFALI
jgi:hypothetical protein